MSNCNLCGSYAINPHLHGRDKKDKDLCDVCYWRKRAAIAVESVKENMILRRLLWLRHGHKSVYGDDGEMQCSECFTEYGFYDYKRTPAVEIESKIKDAALKKLVK